MSQVWRRSEVGNYKRRTLHTRLISRWPHVCRVKITFELLRTFFFFCIWHTAFIRHSKYSRNEHKWWPEATGRSTTTSFVSTKTNVMKYFVNWIPLNSHVRSSRTQPSRIFVPLRGPRRCTEWTRSIRCLNRGNQKIYFAVKNPGRTSKRFERASCSGRQRLLTAGHPP